jgi:GTP-binding protein HflX
LFNRLARADVPAKDMLFATLDPTMRAIDLSRVSHGAGGSHRHVILSDTVGFISDLPTHLVAAFRATLEEVLSADLILHVRDIAHPDTEAQRRDVNDVLKTLGIATEEGGPVLEVLNKTDLLPPGDAAALATGARRAGGVPVSALTGDGEEGLALAIAERLSAGHETVELSVDLADGRTLAWLHSRGDVLERHDDEAQAHLKVRLDPVDKGRLESRLGAGRAEPRH